MPSSPPCVRRIDRHTSQAECAPLARVCSPLGSRGSAPVPSGQVCHPPAGKPAVTVSGMGRKVVSLTMDNLDDLPLPCRNCTLWELGSRAGSPATKDEWLSAVLLD